MKFSLLVTAPPVKQQLYHIFCASGGNFLKCEKIIVLDSASDYKSLTESQHCELEVWRKTPAFTRQGGWCFGCDKSLTSPPT